MSIKRAISAATKRWVSRHGPIARRLAREADRYLRKFHNRDFHIETNGERWLMQRMSGARVVFDVGANTGKWSLMCASICPAADIHAFEVLPSTCDELAANVAGCPRIKPNAVGLADVTGQSIVVARESHNDLTSLVRDVRLMYGGTFVDRPVATCTGDSYCAEHAIAEIDLLKIDTEGAEYLVLLGFKRMLEARAIRVIQFEYGLPNVLSRTLLRDFHDLLRPFGYHVGKLYPDWIDFADWQPQDEDSKGPMFVAALDAAMF
jgi:FkbM family methyltransferase